MRDAAYRIALPLIVVLLAGCAGGGPGGPVVVSIDVTKLVPVRPSTPRVAKIELRDLRKPGAMERTTVGNVQLGAILLSPPEGELVRALLEGKADEVLARQGRTQAPETIHAEIREFQVLTPATALYWDVVTRIELRLQVGADQRMVSARGSERTYSWPGEDVIRRSVMQALEQAAAESEKALEELLRAR